MPEILLNPGVIVFKDPIAKNAHVTRWWAQRGRIHHEDQETGEYGSITVSECLMRLRGLSEMIGRSTRDPGVIRHASEIEAYQQYISQMIDLCKTAKEQGMPDNPAHARQKVEELRAKRQSRLVCLPGVQF